MNIAPYLASKAGMNQLAKNAANEFGKWRIRVNSILVRLELELIWFCWADGSWFQPALVRTEMADLALQNLGVMADIMENTPLGRIGEVADVAGKRRFLR